jgi:hypothetical protein
VHHFQDGGGDSSLFTTPFLPFVMRVVGVEGDIIKLELSTAKMEGGREVTKGAVVRAVAECVEYFARRWIVLCWLYSPPHTTPFEEVNFNFDVSADNVQQDAEGLRVALVPDFNLRCVVLCVLSSFGSLKVERYSLKTNVNQCRNSCVSTPFPLCLSCKRIESICSGDELTECLTSRVAENLHLTNVGRRHACCTVLLCFSFVAG